MYVLTLYECVAGDTYGSWSLFAVFYILPEYLTATTYSSVRRQALFPYEDFWFRSRIAKVGTIIIESILQSYDRYFGKIPNFSSDFAFKLSNVNDYCNACK